MKFRGSTRIQNLVEEHQSILPDNIKLTTIVTDALFDNHDQDIRWSGVIEDKIHEICDLLDVSDARRYRWLKLSPG